MNIVSFKFEQLTLIAILVIFLCCSNVAFAKSRFVPTSDDSNPADSTMVQDNSAMIKQAAHDFEMSLSRWERGHFGALLFYHRTDGPLTQEFQDIIKRDPDLPRVPVFYKTECITCNALGACEAIVTIQFSTEATAKLRKYHLRNTGNWSPYSETTLTDSPQLRASLNACKARYKDILTLHQYSKEEDAVRSTFEKFMRAYRDERWGNLLPLLAPVPQKTISDQLAKLGGEQELLETGKLPETWEFNCAVRTKLNYYYVYAWLANRNQNGRMISFRFKFIPGPTISGWLLEASEPLLNGDFYIHSRGCKPMWEGMRSPK